MPNTIWPFQNNPEPLGAEDHCEECDLFTSLAGSLEAQCICDQVDDDLKLDAAERKFDYQRENEQ